MTRIRMPLLGIVGMVLLLFIVGYFVPMDELADRATRWVERTGPLAGLLYGFIYVAATLFCLPVLPLTIAAGALFGAIKGTLIVSTSTTTAAVIAFLIGRYGARDAVAELAEKYPTFRGVDAAIGREGWKVVALLRVVIFIPLGISNYFYGLTAIRILPYVVATHLAMLPGTAFYSYLGSIGVKAIQESILPGGVQYLVIAIAIAAKLFIIYYVTRIVKRSMAMA